MPMAGGKAGGDTHTHTHTHTHMSTCPYLSYIKTYEFVSQKTTPRHSGKLSGFHSAVERFVFLTRAGSWRRKLRYDAVYNACRRLTGKAVFKVKIKLRNRDSGGSMRVRCPLCTRQLRRKHYVLSVRPSVRSFIYLSGQILLPRYLMNGFNVSIFDESDKEYLL